MKRFIVQILVFFSIATFIIFFILKFSNEQIEKNAKLIINNNTKYIVVGDSHSECCFNDSLIKNLQNFSNSGECYLFTYHKTKNLIENNPNINTIFIEFSNNQIKKTMNDLWIWSDKVISFRYPVFSPFLTKDDQFLLAKNNLSGFLNVLSITAKSNLTKILLKKYNYMDLEQMGGYNFLHENKIDSLIAFSNTQNNYKVDSEISEINLSYLEKTINYCLAKNKEVYLIRSPKHSIADLNNEATHKEILNRRFKSIDFLDFKNFELNNSEYRDFEHVNYKGANKFSIYFDSIIKDQKIIY